MKINTSTITSKKLHYIKITSSLALNSDRNKSSLEAQPSLYMKGSGLSKCQLMRFYLETKVLAMEMSLLLEDFRNLWGLTAASFMELCRSRLPSLVTQTGDRYSYLGKTSPQLQVFKKYK